MATNPARYGVPNPAEPVAHDMPAIRYGGQVVHVRLELRRGEDGTWRGRLLFGTESHETVHATAEIFCAASEADLWQSVRDLRDHHLRDLYRSLL